MISTSPYNAWWELNGGRTTYEGKLGHKFLKNCRLCSLCWIFASGPPREEGACHQCQTECLQHWDFGTSRISFSPHIQTKGFQQRPPPEKSLKLASCQTRPVASLFWQRFCSYPKCIFLTGGGGVKTAFPGTAGTIGRGGITYGPKEGGGTYQNFGLRKSKSGPIQNPQQSLTIACTELCFALGWLW